MALYTVTIDIGPKTGGRDFGPDLWSSVTDEVTRNVRSEASPHAVADLQVVPSGTGALVTFSREIADGADPDSTFRGFLRRALSRGDFAHWEMLTSSVRPAEPA
jgi:hypothetical protein